MHLKKIDILPEKFPTVESYPFNLELFQQTRTVEFTTPVTFFIGENGTGKSTLLRALANKCGIYIWEFKDINKYKYNKYEQDLYKTISIEWSNGSVPGSFFSSEIFKDFSQILDEWAKGDSHILDYFGGESLMNQSHGQSIISYCRSRYKIKGLYLLDEPETALSPKSQIALLELLTKTSQQGHAQFIIATHSPILLACPGANILSFDHIPLKQIDYEETEHYRIYKDFMEDRNRYLN